MPGASGPKAGKNSNSTQSKSRSKSRSKALDAFALAEAEVGPGKTKGVRTRDLEPSPEPQPRNKRSRGDDDDDEDEDLDDDDEENDTRMKKRARRAAEAGEEFDDPDMEMEEDSEGNEWHVGMGPDDDDSEIDSDDAFGEEDEAEFEEFAFRGSKSKKGKKKTKQDEDEEDLDEGDDDEDLESLGSEAIDLATALDQYSETDEEAGGSGSSGSDEDDEDDESSGADSDSDDEDDEDPAARDALKSLISGFAGDEDEDAEAAKSTTAQKAKIGLKDLGLFGVKDPHIKKSLKLMNKEEKATKPGSSKKLDIPLARRQQDKLLRTAAFEKTSETLDRWTDTVKLNRRAEHLFFPLAQNAHDAGLDNGELLPLNPKAAGTELEQTIMAIMEESGLGPSSKQKQQKPDDGEPQLSKAERKELANQRRRERDLASRELARAKRIKKIKSKAYRRVHRKERLGDEEATLAAMKEAGEIDSDEEKEAQDRRRAMERMGAKHKESKWAKMGAKAGRAVWDDDFRSGLTEMARRDEELRKRVEGRGGADEDDDDDDDVSEASADSETERRRLLRDLDHAAADDGKPQSALMQMKFMQRGEEALRKANDELVEQIRRDLASDAEEEDEDQEQPDVGRRQYGVKKSTDQSKPADSSRRVARAAVRAAEQQQQDGFVIDTAPSKSGLSNGLSESQNESLGAAGAWSRAGQASRKGKKGVKTGPAEELDFSNAAILATTKSVSKPKKSQPHGKNGDVVLADGASSDEEEDALHLPMAIRDTELIKRAFAGEDVVGEFQREKAEVADDDDEKEVDNTLPGWGSWVGDGVGKKQKQKHAGRFITKVEGVKKKDRKDWKLERVIVNEKRVKKVSCQRTPIC
jgi:U3 small nucleolar RNA-associated protein 14